MPALVSRGSRGRRAINDINMVPFIDVMLVLLIIFMVTAPLIAPSVVDLPSVGKANTAPDRVLQITIEKDETLSLRVVNPASGAGDVEPRKLAIKALVAEVKKAQGAPAAGKASVPVVIAGDKAVRYEAVVKVMDELQRAGVQRVGLAVQTAR
jgi:biopolymer transport protein TolR